MPITLFGRLRDEIGPELHADIPAAGCSIAALRALLVRQDPVNQPLASLRNRACVDAAIVPESFIVQPGQQIAFLPPVSGG